MDQIIDWVYSQIVGFLGDFFAQMGNMGVELFEMSWVQSIVLFFSYLAWTLYIVGLVVSAFETGIDYQNGRGSVKDTLLNALKGFLAVSLFTTAPIELFKLSVELQASLTSGITGYGSGIDTLATQIIDKLNAAGTVSEAVSSGAFGGLGSITSPIMVLFIIIMMGYAVIKVFFSNLKRGGILLIQISVGSLYGRCAITGKILFPHEIHCHHKMPLSLGGTDKYNNLVILDEQVHQLLHATLPETIAMYLSLLQLTKIQLQKLNNLRKQANLSDIHC